MSGMQQPDSSESTLTFLSDQRRTISPDPRSTDSRFKASWPKVFALIGMVVTLVAVVMVARVEIRGRSGTTSVGNSGGPGSSGGNAGGSAAALGYAGSAGNQDACGPGYHGLRGMDEDVVG